MFAILTALQTEEIGQGVNTTVYDNNEIQIYKVKIPTTSETHTSFFFPTQSSIGLTYYYCLTENDCYENATQQLTRVHQVYSNESISETLKLFKSSTTGAYYGDCYIFIKNPGQISGVYFTVDTAAVVYERITTTAYPKPIYETTSTQNVYNYYLLYYSCTNSTMNITTNKSADIYFKRADYGDGGYLTQQCSYVTGKQVCVQQDAQNMGQGLLSQGLWRVTIKTQNDDPIGITFFETNLTLMPANGVRSQIQLQKSQVCNAYVQLSLADIDFTQEGKQFTVTATNEHPEVEGAVQLTAFTDLDFTQQAQSTKVNDQMITFQSQQYQNLNGQTYLYLIINQKVTTDIFSDVLEATIIDVLGADDLEAGTLGDKQIENVTTSKDTTQQFNQVYDTYYGSVDIKEVKSSYDQTDLKYQQYGINRVFANMTDIDLQSALDSKGVPTSDLFAKSVGFQPSSELYTNGSTGSYSEVLISNSYDDQGEVITVPQKATLYSSCTIKQNDNAESASQFGQLFQTTNILTVIPAESVTTFNSQGFQIMYFKVTATENIKSAGGYKIVVQSDLELTPIIYYSTQDPLTDPTDYEGTSAGEGSIPTNGYAELVIEQTSDIYVGVRFTGTTSNNNYGNKFYVYTKDEDVTQVQPDSVQTVTIPAGATVQYDIPINGLAYNQQQAYVKLAFANDTYSCSNVISYVVTSERYEGDANSCPENIKLTEGKLNPSKRVTSSIASFKNRVSQFLHLTITNYDSADQQVKFQLTQPTQIVDNTNITVPFIENNNYAYTQMDISARDLVKLQALVDSNTIRAFVCPYDFLFIDELNQHCSNLTITNKEGQDATVYNLTQFGLRVGTNYIVFSRVSLSDTLRINVLQSKYLSTNQEVEIKTAASGDSHYYINLDEQQFGRSYYLGIVKCDNCIICSGYQDHAPFSSFDYDGTNNIYCQTIIGNVSYNTQQYNITYDLNATKSLANNQNTVYLIVRSMSSQGISQSIKIRADIAQGQVIDTPINVQLKYSNYDKTIDDKQIVYSKLNYDFQINCNALVNDEVSLTVTPDITQSPAYLFESQYTIYASLDTITPDLQHAYASSAYNDGLAIITFKSSDIKQKWCNETSQQAHIYALIKASDFMTAEAVPTVITLNVNNPNDVVYDAPFNTPVEISAPAGQRRLEHFNVIALPMQFTVTSCVGNAHVRVGYTDYYTRTTYGDGQTSDNGWMIYSSDSEHTQADGDIIINVKSGTRMAFKGDYVIEVQDSNTDYVAHLKIGNDDVNPGVPIRTLTIGQQDGNILARFAPASPLLKESTQADLEYALFIVPQKSDQDSFANPYAACGYTVAGFQMSDWKTFYDFDDFFTIQSNYNQNDLNKYVQDSETNNYYFTVVVRQKTSQFLNSYKQQLFDINNIPAYPYGNSDKVALGVIIGCTIGAVALICGIIGGIYFYKRKQAKNPYQFDTKVNWDE